MAVIDLSLDTPQKVTLATTYQEFRVTIGRNLLYTFAADVFYHPKGQNLDTTAVSATEQMKLSSGTNSIRIPRSGCGSMAVYVDEDKVNNGNSFFALAAVTGTVEVWLTVVGENVSK